MATVFIPSEVAIKRWGYGYHAGGGDGSWRGCHYLAVAGLLTSGGNWGIDSWLVSPRGACVMTWWGCSCVVVLFIRSGGGRGGGGGGLVSVEF